MEGVRYSRFGCFDAYIVGYLVGLVCVCVHFGDRYAWFSWATKCCPPPVLIDIHSLCLLIPWRRLVFWPHAIDGDFGGIYYFWDCWFVQFSRQTQFL